MVQLIASNQLTLTNLNEKAIDRTEISFWHGLSATKRPLGIYDCSIRDHKYGNEFNVTSGETYTVRVIAKQTKGSIWLAGGIWYTAMTSGYAYDTYGPLTLVGEASEDGIGVYERKLVVASGKTKAKIFIQIEQGYSDCSTAWRIYDGQVFDENGQPLVTDQNNYGALASPMATPNGTYIWKRTITYYTDGTSNTIWEYSGVGKDGVAGKDGVGIQTTIITYAQSISGTTAPTTGWTTQVPTLIKGQYLWTKTVWAYTDNTSETGYSVAKMGNNGATGPQGPQGNTGPQGPAGSKGDPGKVVSETEPTTRFEGLTWKYSGVADLTASDGTVIKPNTEYYFNGNHWMVNYLSVNNIEANSITADLINAKNLTITDGEFVSKTTQGFVTISTEIKDNHISISKDDSASDILNSITLDPEQGLAMAYLNRSTGDNRGVGVNFQGLFTNDNAGNYAQLTPQGTKLSTDVPWTSLTPTGGFNGGSIQFSVQNGVAYFSVSALSVPAMTANNWYQCAQLPTGSSAIPSVNKVTTAFGNASVWGFYVSRSGGLFFQCKSNVSATGNLANALAAFPIG